MRGFRGAAFALAAIGFLASPAVGQDAIAEALSVADDLGWVVGEPDAPGTIVEFTDYSCPYCAGFHEGTRAELRREFVDGGRVRWITLSYVSGLYSNSRAVSVAAECAGRAGMYEELMGAAFTDRDRWVDESGAAVAPLVRRWASELGIATEPFEACLADPAVTERLDAIAALAREVGVRGTPTWFVEGFPVMGNLPLGYARQFIVTRVPAAGSGDGSIAR